MKLFLNQIEERFHIPRGTMRSAISRKIVTATKEGKILQVDEDEPTFLAYRQSYHPRGGSVSPPFPRSRPSAPTKSRGEVYASAGSSSSGKG